MQTNFNIEDFLSLDGYANVVRKKRRKDNNGIKATNEFFTPYSIVKQMCDMISDEDWADSTKTFLESSFGNVYFYI